MAVGQVGRALVPAGDRDPLAVGAEGHALGASLQAIKVADRPAEPGIPQDQFRIVGDLGVVILLAGAGDQQPAIGAEGHAVDQAGVARERTTLEVAGTLDEVPFPAAQGGRALLQQPLGPGDVGQRLALGQADSVDVELSFQGRGFLAGLARS